MKTELQYFDGKDNRREICIMLSKLSTDANRAAFIESLIPLSLKGFAQCPMKVQGPCPPVVAYYMMVSICNELGVSINEAASRLENG